MVFEIAAILASGLFAGAAVYINLIEHPARMECGTEIAVAELSGRAIVVRPSCKYRWLSSDSSPECLPG